MGAAGSLIGRLAAPDTGGQFRPQNAALSLSLWRHPLWTDRPLALSPSQCCDADPDRLSALYLWNPHGSAGHSALHFSKSAILVVCCCRGSVGPSGTAATRRGG